MGLEAGHEREKRGKMDRWRMDGMDVLAVHPAALMRPLSIGRARVEEERGRKREAAGPVIGGVEG